MPRRREDPDPERRSRLRNRVPTQARLWGAAPDPDPPRGTPTWVRSTRTLDAGERTFRAAGQTALPRYGIKDPGACEDAVTYCARLLRPPASRPRKALKPADRSPMLCSARAEISRFEGLRSARARRGSTSPGLLGDAWLGQSRQRGSLRGLEPRPARARAGTAGKRAFPCHATSQPPRQSATNEGKKTMAKARRVLDRDSGVWHLIAALYQALRGSPDNRGLSTDTRGHPRTSADNRGLSADTRGHPRTPADTRGHPRTPADSRGLPRTSRGHPRTPADSRGLRGHPRTPADTRGHPRTPADTRGHPRTPADASMHVGQGQSTLRASPARWKPGNVLLLIYKARCQTNKYSLSST